MSAELHLKSDGEGNIDLDGANIEGHCSQRLVRLGGFRKEKDLRKLGLPTTVFPFFRDIADVGLPAMYSIPIGEMQLS